MDGVSSSCNCSCYKCVYVRYCSALLTILWLVYLAAVIVAAINDTELGQLIWGCIWCGFSIIVYGLATYTIHLGKSKNLLIPALCVSLFNVCIGIINGVINFVVLNIFGPSCRGT
ncbi:uncharacterized protein LOC111712713 isoform X2 [Eurytemora carolleeae]|uniref:uncharacterized protein LOC111712713 isoform X2 n=1 Tax=Eurytemora carolleeae TaxID=1294199 RepID=UPI000C7591FD|nr:uncharacterized protein LOC111712713 isoform X2 [Eurytemora carolleeae]|eukprot:XP_023343180.1 uncharacterized protein LOC111712713 isoform X2 [Eurytemora affinis]